MDFIKSHAASFFYDPKVIIVVGDPGVGKTTMLNALLNQKGVTGKSFKGVTSWEDVKLLKGNIGDKEIFWVDTPGLGGPKGRFEEWLSNILDVLGKQAQYVAGIVVLIDGAQMRATMASEFITMIVPQLINPDANPWDRLVIAVSKCNDKDSLYQMEGEEATFENILEGLKASKVKKLSMLDKDKHFAFCGNKGEEPDFHALKAHIHRMTQDYNVPKFVDQETAKNVVTDVITELIPTGDREQVKTQLRNTIEDAYKGSCCGSCAIS